MIPIECPKCGRGGSVPPDRLNARLVCKACHTVFHLDNTGRMVLGDPESLDMKSSKKAKPAEVSSIADFDLAQTWNDIPAAVKYGVPGVLLAAILYVNFGGGAGAPDYVGRAESIVRAVTSNNKSKAVSLATADSAEAAGQWFDLLHTEVEKSQISSDVSINPALFSGNPEKDSDISVMVVLSNPGSSDPPVTISLPMKKAGSNWMLDGTKGLEAANQAAATATKSSPGSPAATKSSPGSPKR